MEPVRVGIDVSKDRLDVPVCRLGEAFAVGRSGQGLDELMVTRRPRAPAPVALEATGGFERVVAAALAGAGLPLVVVNPAQGRHYAQALGRRAKTDAIEAAVIARCAAATRPEPPPLAAAQTARLSEFVTRRRQNLPRRRPGSSPCRWPNDSASGASPTGGWPEAGPASSNP
jgi:transposase